MNAPFFVEVLARNGEVRYRQCVAALPIRIGRGYDNDIILDDRYASAHHAVVESDAKGGMQLRDLGSVNGVIHSGKSRHQFPLDGDTVFRVGHARLRVRAADFSVADALRDTTLHAWEGWLPALAGLALMVLLSLENVWSSDFEKAETIRYVTALAGMLAVVLFWCGGWALANRLFAGQTRFGRHLFIAACGLFMIEVISSLLSIAAYALSLESLTHYGSHIEIAIVAGMVYFHLHTINTNHTRRAALATVLVSLLGSAVMLMFNYQKSGHLADELYMSDLYSPALRLSADKPVGQFLDQAAQLKHEIDEARSKAASDGSE